MPPRIIEKQSEALEVSRRTISLDLLQLRAAIPNLPDVHRTIQLDPVVGARKWMQEAADMGLPCTYVEIKIVLPISVLASCALLHSGICTRRWALPENILRPKNEDQRADDAEINQLRSSHNFPHRAYLYIVKVPENDHY
jgi:hypothetical protein